MKHVQLLFLLGLGFATHVQAQSTSPLERYVQRALDSNLTLQQQQSSIQQAQAALQEAKRLFYPSVDLRADYTLAGGGRTIDLPLGDLLNPVYSTLNQLTASNKFPTLQNESVLLNPHNFYDVRVRTSGPIYNPEIPLVSTIKKQQVALQETDLARYRRDLKQQVQVGYFRYQQAYEALAIYQQAIELLREQVRVNESLQRNGKINRSAVTRAQSELTQMGATLAEAESKRIQAKAYFNFLLNRSLQDSILLPNTHTTTNVNPLPTFSPTQAEEKQLVQQGQKLIQSQIKLTQAQQKPRLNAFVDLGSQAFGVVNRQSWYYLAGVSLQWNLFSFKRQHYKQEQLRADLRKLQQRDLEVDQQLALRYLVATSAFQASASKLQADDSRVKAATQYYQDIWNTYKQGQALYIELLDAQQQLTTAQIQRSLSQAALQEKRADVERAAIQ